METNLENLPDELLEQIMGTNRSSFHGLSVSNRRLNYIGRNSRSQPALNKCKYFEIDEDDINGYQHLSTEYDNRFLLRIDLIDESSVMNNYISNTELLKRYIDRQRLDIIPGDIIIMRISSNRLDDWVDENQIKDLYMISPDNEIMILTNRSKLPDLFRVGKYTRYNPQYWRQYQYIDEDMWRQYRYIDEDMWSTFYIDDSVIDQIYEEYNAGRINRSDSDNPQFKYVNVIMGGKMYRYKFNSSKIQPKWWLRKQSHRCNNDDSVQI